MKNVAAIFVFFSSIVFHKGLAYSSGAPLSRCESMVPVHGVPAKMLPSPYAVKVEKPYYMAGENVTISVESSSDSFKGFLIQARKVGEKETFAAGKFVNIPESTKYVACGNTQGAVTHETKLAVKTMSFEWQPAMDLTGNISFFATVVKDKATFWVKLQSPELYQKELPKIPKFSSSSSSLLAPAESSPATLIHVQMDKSIESMNYISSPKVSSTIILSMKNSYRTMLYESSTYGKVSKIIENIKPNSSPTTSSSILPMMTTLLNTISMYVEVSKSTENVEPTSVPAKSSQIITPIHDTTHRVSESIVKTKQNSLTRASNPPELSMTTLPHDTTAMFARLRKSTIILKSTSSLTTSTSNMPMMTTFVDTVSVYAKVSESIDEIEPTTSPTASSPFTSTTPMPALSDTSTVLDAVTKSTSYTQRTSSPRSSTSVMPTLKILAYTSHAKMSESIVESMEPISSSTYSKSILPSMSMQISPESGFAKASTGVEDMESSSTVNSSTLTSTPFKTVKPTTAGTHSPLSANVFTSMVAIFFAIAWLYVELI